jgi:hypothetical protein
MTWSYPYDLGKPYTMNQWSAYSQTNFLLVACVDKAGTSNQQMLQKELLWNIQGSI